MSEPTIRYTKPNKYDTAKFGTICKVIGDTDDDYELVIQLSEDETAANWQPIGRLLEHCFKQFLNNPVFVSRCLHLYSNTGDKCEQLKEISKLLS